MERLEFKYLNEVELVGPVVRKIGNEKFCRLTIKVPKTDLPNKSKEGETLYNYPDVICFGETAKEVGEKYQVGDTVKINGSVVQRKRVDPDTGRELLEQSISLIEIKEADRIMMGEFGYAEGRYEKSRSVVKLGGMISKISIPYKNTAEIYIRTYIDGKVRTIQVRAYDRQVQKYVGEFQIGTPVFAMGELNTYIREEENGKKVFYQNIVLDGICKAE